MTFAQTSGLVACLSVPMEKVPVLRIDTDLGGAIAEPQRESAERSCLAPVLEIPKGAWDADGTPGLDRAGLGLLVLSGTLCRRVVQNQHYGAELIGPGDLLRPWDRVGEWASIPTGSDWLVIDRARLAVLDGEFAKSAVAFPQIGIALVRRALMRSRYLAILVAVVSQRRVETRLVMLFWHLADRFGQMHGGWVDVPVPLTHSLLGELVAARRPSVTTALSRLSDRGVLRRTSRGWRLQGPVPEEFEQLRRDS
jgi:CRP/FNR family transcriptional regulator, cyclic AMP receptor protein